MEQVQELEKLNQEIALKSIINRALNTFPGAFINRSKEIILVPKYNCFFRLDECESELIFKCKMFEWLSRPICKGLHPRAANNVLRHFNRLLGTNFTREDMDTIYGPIGNCVNRTLTIKFVESGYDMSLLKKDY
ncbi:MULTISPECIES: hypothetical protein [Lysinibacillus]|uniref:hypothetical protein n=1 Tax=Lysinibacillus TaxID=400634 RepID=UPI00214BD8D5|nr:MULTISPECIES: hypothetical protein [Lysinibacillus]UUV26080.1 hypothetical protein NP781_05545 [Lysinibacillus sp. FN11]UYB48953.1 hypothetical protein OCI51_08325 [Lysinibacillus capsici]